jgi:hypothetical protein
MCRSTRRWIVEALRKKGVVLEQLVLPGAVHSFLRLESWVRAYRAAGRSSPSTSSGRQRRTAPAERAKKTSDGREHRPMTTRRDLPSSRREANPRIQLAVSTYSYWHLQPETGGKVKSDVTHSRGHSRGPM